MIEPQIGWCNSAIPEFGIPSPAQFWRSGCFMVRRWFFNGYGSDGVRLDLLAAEWMVYQPSCITDSCCRAEGPRDESKE